MPIVLLLTSTNAHLLITEDTASLPHPPPIHLNKAPSFGQELARVRPSVLRSALGFPGLKDTLAPKKASTAAAGSSESHVDEDEVDGENNERKNKQQGNLRVAGRGDV